MQFTHFSEFSLSKYTQNGLEKHGFSKPTEIQRQSLEHTLGGRDVVGAAKTGSGKTLALIIPVLECLFKAKWSRTDGLGALVIVPTRELAYQIFEVLNKVGANHDLSAALLIGGTDVDYQLKRLFAINVIICTPGRLLQHLEENSNFYVDQLQMLVIDEADRILDLGFRKQMDSILEYLPVDRQTLLFSATQTRKVEDLARVSVKEPVFVDVHEKASNATPDTLNQRYVVCSEENKINFLWSFLKNHKYKKTLVFVTCCRQARFITEALKHLRPGVPLMGLWGTQKQNKRLETFGKFDRSTRGAAMIATDIASRGLDFSGIDWVMQLDCPPTVDDYVHRVGRTARMDKAGDAVLVLTPSQVPIVEMLTARHIPIQGDQFNERKIFDIQSKLSTAIATFPELKDFAQRSIVDYARALYYSKLKSVFDVKTVDFSALSQSYGLAFAPRIRFLKRHGIETGGGGDGGGSEDDEAEATSAATKKRNRVVKSEPCRVEEVEIETGNRDALDTKANSSDEDEPMFKVTRRYEPDPEELKELEKSAPIRPKKAITKQQAAKKLLRKKHITFNSHIKFEKEEGDESGAPAEDQDEPTDEDDK